MMVSVKETSIRRFVCGQLRNEPDLSTLTLGILKRRYLAHVQRESLSPEARHFMKRVIEEELMKMQDNDENGSELETKKPQNKRKREEENDEVISGREDKDESRAKKSRHQLSSSSESEDKEDCKTRSEEGEDQERIKSGSEDEEQEVKSQRKTNGNSKQQMNSEDSTDEENNKSEKEGNESNCADSSKEMVKKRENTTKNGEKRSRNTSQGKKTPQSDEENETDTDSKSERSVKIGNDSSDDSEKEEKVSVEKKNNDPDSDSSSLLSAEDKQDSGTENTQENKKKKTVKKEERARGQKDNIKAVVRLKRYIALCGVRRNYKKLLDGCRSVLAQVSVLKNELEDLGVHGQPSIEKCKKVRMKREEAQELAALDVSNIIATQGRPKRRGASAWKKPHDSPSSTYLRTLNSGSDSDQENNTHRGRRRTTDWANLQGIISDDADSD